MRLSDSVVLLLVIATRNALSCMCFTSKQHTSHHSSVQKSTPSCHCYHEGKAKPCAFPLKASIQAGDEAEDTSFKKPKVGLNRRRIVSLGISSVCMSTGIPRRVNAAPKSRAEGYTVQKSQAEWKSQLTARQYEILRTGGTERPNSSILEGEERRGTYYCAGCETALFESSQKFHSGTGWPSFAQALEGVEVEKVGAIQANLIGAEVRCTSCGGHLGDVFNDGFLFVGTPAFQSGKRFCIDGAALLFRSESGAEVIGDKYPPLTRYY
jgi:peptide-methionine (R)-S-oxide reductase